MLRIRLITALLFFSVWPVAAQQLSTEPANRIALSGERVRIGFSYDVNPDCSSRGQIKSRLLEQPKNGVVEMVTEKGYTRYAKDDQRYKCNENQSDLQAYYYKSREDLKGKDRYVVEVFYPTGSNRKRIFNVRSSSHQLGLSHVFDRRVHRSGIAVSSIAVGDSFTLNLERKLIPSNPSTRFPNGLLSSRSTAVITPNASAFPTLTELAYPISASAFPPTVFMIT